MTDSELIDKLGGPAELARKLAFSTAKGGVQRVHNWRGRGIPAAVKLKHPELFLLREEQPAPQAASVNPAADSACGG